LALSVAGSCFIIRRELIVVWYTAGTCASSLVRSLLLARTSLN
jgi:hypothetical protein